MSRTIPSSHYETNIWSTRVNIARLAEPIRRCVRWRTQVFKIEGSVCKRFLPSLPPPPTFIFWALVSYIARPKPRIFLCSETKRKRLPRRLKLIWRPLLLSSFLGRGGGGGGGGGGSLNKTSLKTSLFKFFCLDVNVSTEERVGAC